MQVIKDKERPKNCHRCWRGNITNKYNVGFSVGSCNRKKKDISRKTGEILVRSVI